MKGPAGPKPRIACPACGRHRPTWAVGATHCTACQPEPRQTYLPHGLRIVGRRVYCWCGFAATSADPQAAARQHWADCHTQGEQK